MTHRCPIVVRAATLLAVAWGVTAATATPAHAHGGEAGTPARELVQTAIAILEVHPAPGPAVDDKIHDAQEATDRSGVRIDLVREAGEALDRGDVAATERLLEAAVGTCPDSDVLYVADRSARPPCVVPAHARALPRRSVGGASEVVLLVVAAVLALGGVAVVRLPFVRVHRAGAS